MTFKAGDTGTVGGINWRVVQGKKSPSDLRLDLCAPRWIPPSMTLSFLFADFYAQNERTLAQEGYLAPWVAANPGARYLRFVAAAMEPGIGWQVARDQLEIERALKKAAA